MTKARDLANLITGGFTADDIPALPASKITSGTFADARLSASSVTQHAQSEFASGDKMLFKQSSAPTGWTKETSDNDCCLRVVSGSVSTGGSVALSTALATPAVSASLSGAPDAGNLSVSMSGNISNHTLSNNQMPSHSHNSGIYYYEDANRSPRGARLFPNQQDRANNFFITGNSGGSGSHNHGHNLSGSMSGAPGVGNLAVSSGSATINCKYVDVICAAKD